MKIEMTGLEKLNLDCLEFFKNNPILELKLDSETSKFLINYAKNREEYTDRSFNEEENKIIRSILDNLFYEHIMRHEKLQKELNIRKEKLEHLIRNERSNLELLHELGHKFAQARDGDNQKPSRWDLFIESKNR